MPITYAIIGLHTGIDEMIQNGSKDVVAHVILDCLDDENPFAVIELTFEGWKVTEMRNVTKECIELAATKRLEKCNTHDDADYYGVADWVRDTDVFATMALGKYSSADALADRWHDERVG